MTIYSFHRFGAFLILFSIFGTSLLGQSFNADFVRYLSPDGITYKDYTKVESKGMNSWHFIPKGKIPSEEYSFISPSQYKVIPNLEENYNQILFSAGSFSLIKEDTLRQEIIIKDGVYTFQNDYEENSDGYFGCFAIPKGFRHLNYVWVFPPNIEILTYESNREGEWKNDNNTLSYIGYEQNNVLFKIRYRPLDGLHAQLEGREVILKDTIEVINKGITISIWDDGQIDNDVISLKVNDEWIVKYLEAKKEKIKFKYFLTQPENYIILRADNVGDIPPNTTAITVDDGENSRTIVLNSDLGTSEAIKINLNTDK